MTISQKIFNILSDGKGKNKSRGEETAAASQAAISAWKSTPSDQVGRGGKEESGGAAPSGDRERRSLPTEEQQVQEVQRQAALSGRRRNLEESSVGLERQEREPQEMSSERSRSLPGPWTLPWAGWKATPASHAPLTLLCIWCCVHRFTYIISNAHSDLMCVWAHSVTQSCPALL